MLNAQQNHQTEIPGQSYIQIVLVTELFEVKAGHMRRLTEESHKLMVQHKRKVK